MADIPLKSFTFPGLPDKYTTPVVDNTLAVAGAAADAKKTGDEIGAIKNDLSEFPNGNYPQMGAGYANQLVSGLKKEDQTPYNFRRIPYDATLEEVKKIVGGTVVNNQLFNFPQQNTSNGVTLTFENGVVTLSGTATSGYCSFFTARITGGHKILVDTKVVNNPDNLTITFGSLNDQGRATIGSSSITNAKNLAYASGIGIEGYGGTGTVFNNVKFQCVCTDLTQMLGTAIADYVYSLESATAGAGVAWLKTHFPKQFDAGYQAYDAGTLKSIGGLSGKKTVGFNQWDGTYEANKWLDDVNGTVTTQNGYNLTDYIKVSPNTVYYKNNSGSGRTLFYDANKNVLSGQVWNTITSSPTTFTTPSEAHYIRFVIAPEFIATFIINLSDPTKNGTYEPYEAHSYALDSDVVLRGIPKLDSNNQLYYDGDEYLPDGTVNRRYGIVDLGSLSYTATIPASGNNYFTSTTVSDVKVPSSASNMANVICARYFTSSQNAWTNNIPCVFIDQNSHIVIADKSYSDASTFKTAMSGVYLVYELATPTTETALPYQETQIVDDFGTEEFVLADGAFPVPVGHNTMYQNNLRAKLEMSPDSPDGDGLYVVQQESGENTYVPLASTATIQDILARLTALENA